MIRNQFIVIIYRILIALLLRGLFSAIGFALSLKIGLGAEKRASGPKKPERRGLGAITGSGSTSCVASEAGFLSSETGVLENNGDLTYLKRRRKTRKP